MAPKQKPGQFVIVRIGEKGEPIPLTIESATSMVVQVVGQTTHMLHGLKAGDLLSDEVGPLG